MRLLLTFTLLIQVAVLGCRADDATGKLFGFATGARFDNGQLEIFPYLYSVTWLNGVRQDKDPYAALHLKPGDVVYTLVCEDRSEFVRYRLNHLTAYRADLVLWTYAAIRTPISEKSWNYKPGQLKTQSSFSVDLTKPNLALVDYGPNKMEVSWKAPTHNK